MKKIICAFLCFTLIFSFALIGVNAEEAKTKTQIFIESIPSGIGAKIKDVAEIYVKGSNASIKLTIPGINIDAKAILTDGKIIAYIFGICKADVTDIVKDFISIDDINSIINEVPKAFEEMNLNELFEYLTLDSKSTESKEIFIPNVNKIKELAIEQFEIENTELAEKTIEELLEYAENNQIDITAINNLLNSKAEFEYDGNKLVSAVITFPADEEFSVLQTIDVFETIGLEYITVDVSDNVFKSPFAIINLTWLVKLIYSLVIGKIA